MPLIRVIGVIRGPTPVFEFLRTKTRNRSIAVQKGFDFDGASDLSCRKDHGFHG